LNTSPLLVKDLTRTRIGKWMVLLLPILVGLTLAALGYLPPILAAAAQSLPDLGILANSSRLLKQ